MPEFDSIQNKAFVARIKPRVGKAAMPAQCSTRAVQTAHCEVRFWPFGRRTRFAAIMSSFTVGERMD